VYWGHQDGGGEGKIASESQTIQVLQRGNEKKSSRRKNAEKMEKRGREHDLGEMQINSGGGVRW